jgi:hypothetical protein
MTSPQNPSNTPAGWYPDPSGTPQQRYWDGVQWTSHYAAPAPAAGMPQAGYAPAFAPAPKGPLAPAPNLWWAAPALVLLALIGSAGTWVTASFGSIEKSVTGLDGGDGFFTLVTAIVALVLLIVWRQAGERWAPIVAAVMATIGTLIPLIYVIDPSTGVDGLGNLADYSRGWGLWLAFLASGGLAVLSVVLATKRRRA